MEKFMSDFYTNQFIYEGKKDRCVILGKYIVETNGTVREAASHFGVSKSTVHKDVTDKLRSKDNVLYADVKKVLLKNKNERHIRGGQATKIKYNKLKESNLLK